MMLKMIHSTNLSLTALYTLEIIAPHIDQQAITKPIAIGPILGKGTTFIVFVTKTSETIETNDQTDGE